MSQVVYKKIFIGVIIIAFFLWSFWELFHCSFHICRDNSLLDIPGVKSMMIRKVLLFVSGAIILAIFAKGQRRSIKK